MNNALPATANGVEGNLHVAVDDFVTFQSLLSDVYQHTGTWSNYDEVDHGRFQYGTSGLDGAHNTWLRVQWAAMDAERRFGEILGEAEAANSELTAQVRMSGAFAALYMGMAFCESVGEPSGPAITDMQSLQLAADRFGAAMQTAQAAGRSDYVRASQAGRAQARALLGDWAGAASDAAAVGSGFSYDARFNDVRTNSVVTLTTKTFNEAAGLMYTLWDRIEQSDKAGYMRDAWSDEPDKRMPVFFDGEVATDNETPHYSQWKYNSRPDDIPMVHSDLMRLIEAEAMLNNSNDYAGATGVLNELRMAVELPPLETPTDAQDDAGLPVVGTVGRAVHGRPARRGPAQVRVDSSSVRSAGRQRAAGRRTPHQVHHVGLGGVVQRQHRKRPDETVRAQVVMRR